MAITNHEGKLLHQMDVKTTFLNGSLNEVIFWEQTTEFGIGELVCELNKPLYCHECETNHFTTNMLNIQFERAKSDCCLLILMHVDDIILMP